jgi:hypothetical protein
MRQAEYTSFLATLVVSVWTTQLRFLDLVDFRVGRAEHPVCDDDLASVRRDVCLRCRALGGLEGCRDHSLGNRYEEGGEGVEAGEGHRQHRRS